MRRVLCRSVTGVQLVRGLESCRQSRDNPQRLATLVTGLLVSIGTSNGGAGVLAVGGALAAQAWAALLQYGFPCTA